MSHVSYKVHLIFLVLYGRAVTTNFLPAFRYTPALSQSRFRARDAAVDTFACRVIIFLSRQKAASQQEKEVQEERRRQSEVLDEQRRVIRNLEDMTEKRRLAMKLAKEEASKETTFRGVSLCRHFVHSMNFLCLWFWR